VSARHSIEPISISFKRGFAALHHALMRVVLDGEGVPCAGGDDAAHRAFMVPRRCFASRLYGAATMLRIAL
jgi:hypothetical protein